MDPAVDEPHEDGPPPTCAQLLDDADISAVPHNVPIKSSCLNSSFFNFKPLFCTYQSLFSQVGDGMLVLS